MNWRNILIVLTIFFFLSATVITVFFARGYNLDIKGAKISPTGILVATSDPDGAEVLINGKLTTGTNNTINLPPGKYLVKIKKEGYTPWEKSVTIKAEEVFKTSAFLFPNLPELRPLTLTGAQNPVLSPSGARIAYSVASASAEKNGLWILDMSRPSLPGNLFASADIRQISRTTPTSLSWSPDEKQILATTSGNIYLLDSDRSNDFPTEVSRNLTTIKSQWKEIDNQRYKSQVQKLHPKISSLLATSSARLTFSPDESKILYQATASASLPTYLLSYLPGTNPTPENRQLTPGETYVYDIKEDRNYLIENCNPPAGGENCSWFPSSRHLLSHNNKEISIMEFDGTNKAVVYSGPFTNGFVFAWPTWGKIIILTSLNTSPEVSENLYSINLR